MSLAVFYRHQHFLCFRFFCPFCLLWVCSCLCFLFPPLRLSPHCFYLRCSLHLSPCWFHPPLPPALHFRHPLLVPPPHYHYYHHLLYFPFFPGWNCWDAPYFRLLLLTFYRHGKRQRKSPTSGFPVFFFLCILIVHFNIILAHKISFLLIKDLQIPPYLLVSVLLVYPANQT